MDRYDRLVRHTIYRASKDRCVKDPQWLDSVASATWAGFVHSAQRDPESRPRSLSAYLAQIARNQVASATRGVSRGHASLDSDAGAGRLDVKATLEEPVDTLSKLEELEALRGCLAELDAADRNLTSQLGLIARRRWKEAAEALGLSESTLRYRWDRVLARLRRCIERKTGESFAPGGGGGDS